MWPNFFLYCCYSKNKNKNCELEKKTELVEGVASDGGSMMMKNWIKNLNQWRQWYVMMGKCEDLDKDLGLLLGS